MTNFIKMTDQISVTGQINTTDIDRAATQGIALIISNRPDGEEAGQPLGTDLAAYAKTKGIRWVSIPVAGSFPFEAVQMMARAITSTDDPILAFCRTGTRTTHLWALAEAMNKSMKSDDLLAAATQGGYDINALTDTLDQLYNMDAN